MYRSLPIGITLNRVGDGRYVDVNDSFALMTGYSREDLIGKTSEEVGLVLDAQKRREVLDRIDRDGSASNTVIGVTRRSGEQRFFLSNSAIVTLDGKEFILSSSLDVTDRRRADEEIHRLNADLDRRVQERTKELEAFTYTVAHDLRSPIRAMQGFADLVLADAEDRLESQEREYLSRIASAAQRMDVLVCDLLTYSRLGLAELNSEPIDLDRLVQETLHHLDPELKSRRAEVVTEAALPAVLGDRTGLLQVLINLLSNAAKFSRVGVAPVIRISAQTSPGRVRIVVEDNGIGVEPKHRPKLFGIFERLHGAEAYPGTGIGLAIVRRVIERLGGKVGMESADGSGSRFWFELASVSLPSGEASLPSNVQPVSESC
jgi:PAS domain S-box-containing protein